MMLRATVARAVARSLTPAQRNALRAVADGRFVLVRAGWAHDVAAPAFRRATVAALAARRLVRIEGQTARITDRGRQTLDAAREIADDT